MRMKVFQAASMPEAIKLVRAELGEDAIIISTQRADGGVRVTAAIDRRGDADLPLPPIDEPLDVIEAITDALDRHGMPGVLAEQLIAAAMPLAEKLLRAASALAVDAPVMVLAAALDATYRFRPLPERDASPPLMLIGPPGSGKTVTVAKLAARAVLNNRPVHVVTTDTMRAGGIDQLAAFTRILNIDLQTALDAESLGDAITAVHLSEPDALTLIDSAGVNPFDRDQVADLERLISAAPAEFVLVLPAGTDVEEAAETARIFGRLGAKRLLVTRLDAARRLGSILVAAEAADLAFCDLSTRPHVADGLSPINPVGLARLLLPELAPATSVLAPFEMALP